MEDYNEFYKKFAEFVDRLGWTSGCGLRIDSVFEGQSDTEGSPFLRVSDENDGGSFAGCDWQRETEMDKNIWVLDATDRSRGWTGTSGISIDEQQQIKMEFPMPLWLRAVARYGECFRNTAAGKA